MPGISPRGQIPAFERGGGVCPATTREISSPRRMQTPSELRSPASQGIPQRMASPLLMPRGGSPRGRQGGHRPQSEYPGISQTPSVGGRSVRGTEDGGHHGAHQQVYLSLSGVMAGDDRAFDFLYDREDFRAKALEILQKLIPPDRKELGSKKGPSSKRDLPPQWITLCAQQINEAFKLQMKKIITTSRSHNDGEREVLASWLTQRDQMLCDLQAEVQRHEAEKDELRAQITQQHTVFGKQQQERYEAVEEVGELKRQLEEARQETHRSQARERIALDNLVDATEAKDKAVEELNLIKAQAEQLSGDKAGAGRQFQELKQALASQADMFAKMEGRQEEAEKAKFASLEAMVAQRDQDVLDLRERLAVKDMEIESMRGDLLQGDAKHALNTIRKQGEWQAREAELMVKVKMAESMKSELDQAREYAATVLKAYQDQGHSIMGKTPGMMQVRKMWESIYRYVATTNWGRAADLDPETLAKGGRVAPHNSDEGLHQRHTGESGLHRPASRGLGVSDTGVGSSPALTHGDNGTRALHGDGTTMSWQSGRGGDGTSASRHADGNSRRSASPFNARGSSRGSASPSPGYSVGRSMISSPMQVRGLFLDDEAPGGETREGDGNVAVVLTKLRAKWGTVYSTFQKFSGRRSDDGGFDWYFDRKEWLTTLRLLNTGIPDEMILAAFDSLVAGNDDGRLTFDQLQAAMRESDVEAQSPHSRTTPSKGVRGCNTSNVSNSPGSASGSIKSPPLSAVSKAVTSVGSPGGGGLSKRLASAAKSPGWAALGDR